MNQAPQADRVLREHADFRRFWAADAISNVGSSITVLALPLTAALTLHAEVWEFGVLTAAALLPLLLLSLPAGVLVDRSSSPLRLMILADVIRGVLLLAVPAAAALGMLSMPLLFAVALLTSAAGAVVIPASVVLVPALLPRESLPAGNARLGTNLWAGLIAGPALAGVLVQAFSPATTLTLDALSFFVSAALLMRVRPSADRQPRSSAAGTPGSKRFGTEMAEGLRYAARSPSLRAIAGSGASLNLGGFIVITLMVPYATADLGLSPGQIGLVRLFMGAGGLLGTFVATRVVRRFGAGPALVAATCWEGVALIAWPLAGGTPWVALLVVGMSELALYFAVAIYSVSRSTLLVSLIEPHMLGRVSSAMTTVSQGAKPLGALLGGALGGTIGMRPAMVCAALIALTCPLWTLFSPLRHRANELA